MSIKPKLLKSIWPDIQKNNSLITDKKEPIEVSAFHFTEKQHRRICQI
jgi:hypothetical protein